MWKKRTFIQLLLALVIVSGSWTRVHAQTNSCWGNFRGNAEFSGVTKASMPGKPSLLWNFNAQDGIKASPVVCDGVIVVGTLDGLLYGINSDGTLKWKINTEYSIEAPAMIVDGVVYVGNLDGTLYAVDLKTGAIKWTYQTEKTGWDCPWP